MIPVARPRLPRAPAIEPYLRQIDANGWYSNHGPLAREFQRRLAGHWGVAEPQVALVANATSGLTLALQASGARPGTRCLMPSWTFVASAGAVTAAGLVPHFVDVCPDTWAPDPTEVQYLARRHDVGALLVVAPFGAPLECAAWDRVQAETGVPVVIDAAAAFDTLRAGGPMPVGECVLVVSLHATKVFGIGEGGAVIARDPALIRRVHSAAQFGFAGTRTARRPGVNAKLSEYAAAAGLAGLDEWTDTRARWDRVTQRYVDLLPPGLGLAPRFGRDWVASTLTILWPEDRPRVADALTRAGVSTLCWWGPGCHAQPAYLACPSEPLPITAVYARRAIGLPFWQDLPEEQIALVCDALRRALHRSLPRPRAVARRLVAA
jgi:dTDP-4-amino-4,6-dideoxygalactose transaminase